MVPLCAAFFSTLPDGDRPHDVYFSFYREWPSFLLEDAVRAMNTSWHGSFNTLDEPRPALYRLESRGTPRTEALLAHLRATMPLRE